MLKTNILCQLILQYKMLKLNSEKISIINDNLEKLRDCLLNLSPEINIDNELILKAKKPLNTMLKLS